MIANVEELLLKAKQGGYAVGAFNTVNLETTRAILEAASEMESPIIIQMTEKTLDYAGGRAIYNLVKNLAEYYFPQIPVGIHLDHGKSFEIIQRATEIGFTSVMYDGSRHEYNDNVAITKKVVEFCHERGVMVQAELGNVPYLGEIPMHEINWDEYMTDPDQAKEFVEQTGIDTLAVAIGNAHGFFHERSVPDYERLEAIAKQVSVPIILHGASDWENGKVVDVIKKGVSCFNVDTATRLAFLGQLQHSLAEGNETDLRKVLGASKEAVKKIVKDKIAYFGSKGKI